MKPNYQIVKANEVFTEDLNFELKPKILQRNNRTTIRRAIYERPVSNTSVELNVDQVQTNLESVVETSFVKNEVI